MTTGRRSAPTAGATVRPAVRPLAFGLGSIALLLAAAGCVERERPNLLILVSDAFRADALACAGGGARTPNLCALAARGVLFEQAYANAPWTLASTVSMFTGRPPGWYRRAAEVSELEAGTRIYRVPEDELLLGEALAGRGYEVRAEIENPVARQTHVFQGFARSGVGRKDRSRVLEGLPVALRYRPRDRRYLAPVWLLDLFARPRKAPFAALHWIDDPHAPYRPPPALLAGSVPEGLPRPVAFYLGLGHHHRPGRGEHNLRRVAPSLTPEELAFVRRLYLLEVESVDERVGLVLDALDRSGLADHTLVVFTADHGEAFGEHGDFLHGVSLYDELVRVPLVVAGPGVARGHRVRGPVSHLDLVPTLADLLGLDGLGPFLGESLRPQLEGVTGAGRRFHYLSSPERLERQGVVHGRYKLVAGTAGDVELYDLVADPQERRELSRELPDVRDGLLRALGRFQEEERRLWLTRQEAGGTALDAREREETVRALRAMGYVD